MCVKHLSITSSFKPNASKIFANEILRGAPLLKTYLEENYSTWLQRKKEVIRSWIKQGRMDDIDPLNLIFMIWATTQHYADFEAQLDVLMPDRDAAWQQALDFTDQMFRRMLTPQP